jgi:hypothetical protein
MNGGERLKIRMLMKYAEDDPTKFRGGKAKPRGGNQNS